MSSHEAPRETWSSPWQARLKHLADNLGPGAPGSATPGAGVGAAAGAGVGALRRGLRVRGAVGVAGSWLGRARSGGAVARSVRRQGCGISLW
jgi:hypothetical protein